MIAQAFFLELLKVPPIKPCCELFLCFNETSCDTNKLPNGKVDILLDGFHPPKTRSPTRSSNKGGGLAIYVNKSLCNEDDIEELEIEVQTSMKEEQNGKIAELNSAIKHLKIQISGLYVCMYYWYNNNIKAKWMSVHHRVGS